MSASPVQHHLQPDDVLMFIHIFKTAGTALTHLVEQQFAEHEIYARRGAHILRATPDELKPYRYVTGHYPYSAQRLLPRKPVMMTILREPVARALSFYGYTRLQTDPNPIHDIARATTLDAFVRHPLVERDIANMMTWFLAAEIEDYLARDRMLTADDLQIARTRLQEMAFVGLTEHFAESVWLLHHTFGWSHDVEIKRINATPNPVKRDDVSQATIDHIIALNQLDIELYALAEEIFWRRFGHVDES
ncbi:MAG: hypothetical protein D6737_03380 [Chloroflexi bacterium]|nr:MAG: hypothetical protein D6737_03380 [Chloroflexota bacterium]